MKKRFFFSLSICIFIFLFFSLVSFVSAYGLAQGIAYDVQVSDKNIPDGSIISFNNGTYSLSGSKFDSKVVGIVFLKPAVSFSSPGIESSIPIVNSGYVRVRVNEESGQIKEGDFVTTSSSPGIGMKGGEGKYAIGVALQDVAIEDGKTEGLVLINLKFGYTGSDGNTALAALIVELEGLIKNMGALLQDLFGVTLLARRDNPTEFLKYLLGSLVVLFSILFSLFTFAKVARQSIIAFGRNPLAGRLIGFGLIMNIFLSLAVIGVGFGLAFLIIKI